MNDTPEFDERLYLYADFRFSVFAALEIIHRKLEDNIALSRGLKEVAIIAEASNFQE